jgi:pimeloyl-ACP methyl ester carboxylesterase
MWKMLPKVSYSIVGHGGRELVFLHGWAANSRWWVRQVPVISKDYKMILVDLPGHGLFSSL